MVVSPYVDGVRDAPSTTVRLSLAGVFTESDWAAYVI
jgi:hypothetical protein